MVLTRHAALSEAGNNVGMGSDLTLCPTKSSRATVDICSLPTNDGILVKVTPPDDWDKAGSAAAEHVPCDIVLVIDVSGSMGMDAPVPAAEDEAQEDTGLSVLDLVKHAARTICETLDDDDRLAIVTFSAGATVLQELVPMTAENKALTESRIAAMQPQDQTNLWHGVLAGRTQFEGKADSGRVPSIMVLTDGVPNFMDPAQGYIPKLRTLPPSPAPIHTFGFGYSLRSGLLKSLSEATGGNYSFIPDAGMIGTVFVHAVANMQSTFATDAVVHLSVPDGVTLTETLGRATQRPHTKQRDPCARTRLTVNVGTLQYGQSRDIYLAYELAWDAGSNVPVTAELEYRRTTTTNVSRAEASCRLTRGTRVPLSGEAAFHISRSLLCSFIAGYFPLNGQDEHTPVAYRGSMAEEVAAFAATLPAGRPEHAGDPMCKALMADVRGQVTMALSNLKHYNRWGMHYLPSLQGAHAVQQCNSFKDPGVLLYAVSSPRFIACRNALDTAFDTLPPPEPSNARSHARGGPRHAWTQIAAFGMSSYRNASVPCFAGFCRVSMASGKAVRVHRLRKGMQVQTPRGPRAVRAVLKTPVGGMSMVVVGRLLITTWHPVSHNGADWVFPCRDKARKVTPVRYTGSIYSVLLEEDDDADAHAVLIEGIWAVTLGHGLADRADATNPRDVRIHGFLGDYAAVCRSLATLDVRKDGLVINGGATRSNVRQWHTTR